MSSAIGTLALLSSADAVGPLFVDTITMVGDATYTAGASPNKGTPSFQAAFRKLMKASRTVLEVTGYADSEGYSVRYHAPVVDGSGVVTTPDSLEVRFEDQTSGVVAEKGSGDLSARTFTLIVRSN